MQGGRKEHTPAGEVVRDRRAKRLANAATVYAGTRLDDKKTSIS